MKTILGAVSLVVLMGFGPSAQAAQVSELIVEPVMAEAVDGSFDVAEGDAQISEGQAADIAQSTQPGAKVIKVKLLPSGVYAVTLKEGGNVTRVMVDANSGAIL